MASQLDHRLFILLLSCLLTAPVNAQMQHGTTVLSEKSAKDYSEKIFQKVNTYETRLSTKTEKVLTKLSRWENKIRAIVKSADPALEERLFSPNQQTFNGLLTQLKAGESLLTQIETSYNAYLDTITTSLNYLDGMLKDSTGKEAIAKAAQLLPGLKNQMRQADYIAQFIKQRKALLIKEAGSLLKRKLITKINKEDYYFGQALVNYKETFSDQTKTEVLVKRALNEIPAFKEFMQRNSGLASLFRIPGSDGGSTPSVSLAGLQTRASVQNVIQQRIAAGGPNAADQLRQNLGEAQTKLNELKDKLLKGGMMGSGGEVEMPDFKPNQQHSKTLWQRLEYGFDVQFVRGQSFLPATTDIAANAGYKLNDKSVIGIGISYKMGIGSIDHIRFSSEGMGLRSFFDWKIKGSIYASGGYEMNYNSSFKNIEQLMIFNAWQRSALAGVSKKYKISKKMKGEVRLLYDFLANNHVPVSAPFVFRVGYKF